MDELYMNDLWMDGLIIQMCSYIDNAYSNIHETYTNIFSRL
jgi:hypothetical protein